MDFNINCLKYFVLLFFLSLVPEFLMAQNDSFDASKIKQIKNYKSFQLDNGLSIIHLDNGDSSGFFVRAYTNLPQYVAKSNNAALAIDTELRKLKGFDFPFGKSQDSFKGLDIDFQQDENGFYAYAGSTSLDTLLYFFSDLFLKPIIDNAKFDESKKNILFQSDSISKLPEDKIDKITKSIIYGKEHPILKLFLPSVINNVSKDIYLDFYNRFYKPNNSYLLVIGKISRDSLLFLANKNLGTWKKKDLQESTYKLIPIEEPKIVFFDTIPNGQTNIKILFPFALHPFTFDSEKAELLSLLFQKMLWLKLVEQMKLAKSIDARFESDKITGNYQLNLSLEKDSLTIAVQAIIETISDLKSGKYPQGELNLAKHKIIADFKNQQFGNAGISWLIINTERNNLPKEYYADFIESINAIDQSGIITFTAKYLNYNTALFQIPGRWYQSLNEFIQLSKQFRIELYHLNGNIHKIIPKGFNGFSVIDNYVKSVGGIENIQKIKDVSIKYGAIYELVSGEKMYVEGQMLHKAENKYFSKSYMIRPKIDTVFLQQEVFDGSYGTDSSMYQKRKLQSTELEILKYKSPFVPEIDFKTWGYQVNLVKADTINGNYTWIVVIDNPARQRIIDYYDVDKGLRYKRIITDNAFLNKRTIDYSKYQRNAENEILYPFLKIITANETTIRMIIREVDYKTKINKKLFEIIN